MDDDSMALLQRLYAAFNARDIEGVFLGLADDVWWANGMEGGHVKGKPAIREYWTRQWSMFDPHVEPLQFAAVPPDAVRVEVRQVVRDLAGSVVSDGLVVHRFTLQAGRVARFDIDSASPDAFHR